MSSQGLYDVRRSLQFPDEDYYAVDLLRNAERIMEGCSGALTADMTFLKTCISFSNSGGTKTKVRYVI